MQAAFATSSVFTANSKSGSYLVTATSGIGSVDFHLANVVLYVAPGGSDANDCLSVATACASLQGAIDKAFDGDVIFAAEGTYSSSDEQVVSLSKSLTLSAVGILLSRRKLVIQRSTAVA